MSSRTSNWSLCESAPEWMKRFLRDRERQSDQPIALTSVCADVQFTKPRFLHTGFSVVLLRLLGHGTSGLVVGCSLYGDSGKVVTHALKIFEPGADTLADAELRMHLRVGYGSPGKKVALPVAFDSFTIAGVKYCGLLFPRLSALSPKLIASTSGEGRMALCRDLLECVEFLHGMSLAHCDLKPGNVLVRNGEEELTLVLGDLGSAMDFEAAADAHTSEYRGTPFYSSPAAVKVWLWQQDTSGDGIPTYNAFVQDLWGVVLSIVELATGERVYVDVSSAETVQTSVLQWRSGKDRSCSLEKFVASSVSLLERAEATHLVDHNLCLKISERFDLVDVDAFVAHDDDLEAKLYPRVAALKAEVLHLRQTLARVTRPPPGLQSHNVGQVRNGDSGRPPLANLSPQVVKAPKPKKLVDAPKPAGVVKKLVDAPKPAGVVKKFVDTPPKFKKTAATPAHCL